MWAALVAVCGASSVLAGNDPDGIATYVFPPVLVEGAGSGRSLESGFPVSRASWADQRGWQVADLLASLPGLVLQEGFGGIDPPRLSVRGSGLQSAPVNRGLAIWLDDLPFGMADGSFNLSLLEPALTDGASLALGSSAGASALGGVLRFRSRSWVGAEAGGWHLGWGSDRFLAARLGGAIGPQPPEPSDLRSDGQSWSFAGGASYRSSEGWREQSSYERAAVNGRLSLAMPQGPEFALQIYGAWPRYEVPGPLPLEAALQNPRSNSPAVKRDLPERRSAYTRMGLTFRTPLEEGGFWRVGAFAARHEDDFQQLVANGISHQRGVEGGFVAEISHPWGHATSQHSTFHLVHQAGDRTASRYRNLSGQQGPLIGDNRLLAHTLSLGLSHEAGLCEHASLFLGLGGVWARREIQDRLPSSSTPPATAVSSSDLQWQPRIGLNWSLGRGFSWHLGWSRAWEPPTFDDLLFLDGPATARVLRRTSLRWQRADTWEMGLQWSHGGLSLRSGPYQGRWHGELLRLVAPDGSPLGTVNAGQTRHRGWESSLRWVLPEAVPGKWSFTAVHQWSDHRLVSDPVWTGNRLAGVPPHSGSVTLEGRLGAGWSLAPAFRWQSGKTYADHANTLSSSGFWVASCELGWRSTSLGWRASLRVENLLDRRYIASSAGLLDRAAMGPATPIFLPAPPRRWEIALGRDW